MAEGIDMLGSRGTYVEIGNLMRCIAAVIEPPALLKNKHIFRSVICLPPETSPFATTRRCL
jgi:hypothetical protein